MKRLAPTIVLLLLAAGCAPARRGGPVVLGDDGRARTGKNVHAPDMKSADDSPSDCADDPHEDDDDSGSQSSTNRVLAGGATIKAVSCPGDDDWFHSYVDGRSDAGVKVTWNAADGLLRIDLYDATGRLVAFDRFGDVESRTDGMVELLDHNHTGDFYARVRNRSGARIEYSIVIENELQ